jgi:hypothetical protein
MLRQFLQSPKNICAGLLVTAFAENQIISVGGAQFHILEEHCIYKEYRKLPSPKV